MITLSVTLFSTSLYFFFGNSVADMCCTNSGDNRRANVVSSAALVVGVTSTQCASGRVYVGNVNLTSAELIVFNGIYVQQQPDDDSGRRLPPIYKHELREQFLHVVFVDDQPYWRVGVRRVGGRASAAASDFVDYLSARSTQVDNVTSPEMTSRWHVWSARAHSWSLAPRLRATCVEPDFVTCTSGLLRLSGLSARHQRWHRMRMGTYRLTELTNELRPVYKSVLFSVKSTVVSVQSFNDIFARYNNLFFLSLNDG